MMCKLLRNILVYSGTLTNPREMLKGMVLKILDNSNTSVLLRNVIQSLVNHFVVIVVTSQYNAIVIN